MKWDEIFGKFYENDSWVCVGRVENWFTAPMWDVGVCVNDEPTSSRFSISHPSQPNWEQRQTNGLWFKIWSLYRMNIVFTGVRGTVAQWYDEW